MNTTRKIKRINSPTVVDTCLMAWFDFNNDDYLPNKQKAGDYLEKMMNGTVLHFKVTKTLSPIISVYLMRQRAPWIGDDIYLSKEDGTYVLTNTSLIKRLMQAERG